MTWFAGRSALDHRRRRREARRAAMAGTYAPPVEHAVLGLGGRSIELSLAQGFRAAPDAFELAVDELHAHVVARDAPDDELRAAGRWLSGLPNHYEMSHTARTMLRADLDALKG